MFGFNRMALFSPEDGETGGGASGEVDEGEQGKKSDDDVVPKTQFLAALRSAEEKRERELAALRAEFEGKLEAATKPKVEAPKVYTRAELKAMVDAGQISEAQADAQIEHQITANATAEAVRAAQDIVGHATRTNAVGSEIARYSAAVPEILDTSSKTRAEVKAAYDGLVALGDPRNVVTELKALRQVLGSVDKVERARSGRASHESHQESGGEGEQHRRGGEGKLKLSPKERAHYEPRVGPGKMYPDWKAVEAELQFAKPSVRRKHGAPV